MTIRVTDNPWRVRCAQRIDTNTVRLMLASNLANKDAQVGGGRRMARTRADAAAWKRQSGDGGELRARAAGAAKERSVTKSKRALNNSPTKSKRSLINSPPESKRALQKRLTDIHVLQKLKERERDHSLSLEKERKDIQEEHVHLIESEAKVRGAKRVIRRRRRGV